MGYLSERKPHSNCAYAQATLAHCMSRTSTAKRRKGKPPSKKRSKKRSVPKKRVVKRKPKPKPKKKRSSRSAAAKKGWATRRARQRERDSDLGDVEVQTGGWEPDEDYEAYPTPEISAGGDSEIEFEAAAAAFDRMRLEEMGDHALDAYGEIEWFPRFDEVYDYIDALVEEFDLDAHELFEMAFGYSDEASA